MMTDLIRHIASYLISIVIGGTLGLAFIGFADLPDLERFIIGVFIGIPLAGYVTLLALLAWRADRR